jgi:DNA-binding NtrC family response regulator
MFKILLVDDDECAHYLIKFFLKSLSCQFDCAMTIAQALACTEHTVYDLIITDIALYRDRLGGLLFLEAFRKSSPNTPVIVTTAHRESKHHVQAKKCGALEVLTKPLDFERLQVIVSSLLKKTEFE